MDIKAYWDAVLKQDAKRMKIYFNDQAFIYWHNTNEKFTAEEFICANCEYPGQWNGEIERIEKTEKGWMTVVHVYGIDQTLSFHVVSFIEVRNDKILRMDEYWGEDGQAPQWRLDKKLGTRIK